MNSCNIIKSKYGYNLSFSNIYMCRTYDGIMMGSKSDSNQIILSSPYNRYLPRMWEKWPFIEFGLDEYRLNFEMDLPQISTCAMITCDTGIDFELDLNSSIIGFWFQETLFDPPSQKIIDMIENFNWKKAAKNWEW